MPKRNLAWILIVVVITFLVWRMPQTIAGRDSVYQAFGPLVDARTQIHRRSVVDVSDGELVSTAVHAGIESMIALLDDPYADYLDQEEYERSKKRTDGMFGGIGADVWATDRGLQVLGCEPGTPAARADIQVGDIITHVDGRPTVGMSLVDAVNNLLNGPPQTEVTLTIVTPDADASEAGRDITLRRAVIDVDPVRGWSRSPSGGWRFMLDPDTRIAYVRLTKFTRDVHDRLDARMNRLLREDIGGLVLDLRENTGGLLESAIEVADRFLDSGLIVSTRGRKTDAKRWFATHDIGYPEFPIAVIVNESTASAAEIVAGALRDHGRATVVGERSYGKGSVQEVVELSRRGGAVKLTTAYYFLPKGECIHRSAVTSENGSWGVAPNIPVNLTAQQKERWLRRWLGTGGEAAASPGSQPAETEAQSKVDGAQWEEAAAFVKGDLQLQAAVEHLKKQLAGPAARGRHADREPAGKTPTG
jgi:carboxyl-terminal processing protease